MEKKEGKEREFVRVAGRIFPEKWMTEWMGVRKEAKLRRDGL